VDGIVKAFPKGHFGGGEGCLTIAALENALRAGFVHRLPILIVKLHVVPRKDSFLQDLVNQNRYNLDITRAPKTSLAGPGHIENHPLMEALKFHL
jgi:hypothetical protein